MVRGVERDTYTMRKMPAARSNLNPIILARRRAPRVLLLIKLITYADSSLPSTSPSSSMLVQAVDPVEQE